MSNYLLPADLHFLPNDLSSLILAEPQHELTDIQLDIYTNVRLIYGKGVQSELDYKITQGTLIEAEKELSFDRKNRAALDGALHRVSRIQGFDNDIVGLTIRVGRHIPGLCALVADILESGKSMLIVGKAGSGKTTMLRDLAGYLGSALNKNTVIVDYSAEIGGLGRPCHECIHPARQFPVRPSQTQGEAMVEALENHTPEAMIVDELSDHEQVKAACSISARGVQLIATMHGSTLSEVLLNPDMRRLLGGIGTLVVGDVTVTKQNLAHKTVRERREPSSFGALVFLTEKGSADVYLNAEAAVDALLAGKGVTPETRRLIDGKATIITPSWIEDDTPEAAPEFRAEQFGARVRKSRQK